MLSYIKDSFQLTNKYIILATPLILFSLLSSLYILFSVGGNLLSLLIALLLFCLMVGAFLSGWFFMIKTCVSNPEQEDPNVLLKEFPAGVGEYFLPVLGLMINTIIISVLLILVSYFVGMKLIGDIGITPEALTKGMESFAAMKTFLGSLTQEQIFKLNAWNMLLFFTMSVTYFLIMFYSPALFFKEKNPFKAYFVSLKDLFSKKFFTNFGLFLILFVSYFILSIFTTLFGANVVMHFIFTLVNFYYLVFVAVMVYNYYYKNFVQINEVV